VPPSGQRWGAGRDQSSGWDGNRGAVPDAELLGACRCCDAAGSAQPDAARDRGIETGWNCAERDPKPGASTQALAFPQMRQYHVGQVPGAFPMKAVAAEKHRGTLNLIPYKPGQSGNPGGRTKEFAECQRICREASREAAQTMIGLLESDDDRVRLMAADKILERAPEVVARFSCRSP
jgi:hypothetical protein